MFCNEDITYRDVLVVKLSRVTAASTETSDITSELTHQRTTSDISVESLSSVSHSKDAPLPEFIEDEQPQIIPSPSTTFPQQTYSLGQSIIALPEVTVTSKQLQAIHERIQAWRKRCELTCDDCSNNS